MLFQNKYTMVYKRRVGRPRKVHRRKGRGVYIGRRRLIPSNRRVPQYVLKPRLTTKRSINPLRSNNFRQKFFAQTGSGRRKRRGGRRVLNNGAVLGGRRRRKRRGGNLWSVAKHYAQKAHDYVKKNKILSTYGHKATNYLPTQYRKYGHAAADFAKKLGYGRRHRRRHRRRRRGRGFQGFQHKGVVAYGPAKVVGGRRRGRGFADAVHNFANAWKNRPPVKGGRRRRRGRGVWDDIKSGFSKANDWLKKTRFVSRAGHAVSDILPPQYGAIGHVIADGADKLGYGRRRMHRKTGRGIGQTGGLYTTRVHAGYGGHAPQKRRHGRGTPFPFVDSDAVKGKSIRF